MDNLERIKSEVSFYIQGKYGLIGIRYPDKETTEEEWDKVYTTIVKIVMDRERERKETE